MVAYPHRFPNRNFLSANRIDLPDKSTIESVDAHTLSGVNFACQLTETCQLAMTTIPS